MIWVASAVSTSSSSRESQLQAHAVLDDRRHVGPFPVLMDPSLSMTMRCGASGSCLSFSLLPGRLDARATLIEYFPPCNRKGCLFPLQAVEHGEKLWKGFEKEVGQKTASIPGTFPTEVDDRGAPNSRLISPTRIRLCHASISAVPDTYHINSCQKLSVFLGGSCPEDTESRQPSPPVLGRYVWNEN